ncbi:sensor domain-containing diguanylate cyclase [Anatilimnocola floriformis]|uniref:sensor domain-containing diguanylate cyclase n=1 Tax=Anatilimnocola floriformis TaxID=2948575 RepID=UPI0020C3D11D|nr:diguanylate cyclase [Anatilimnocola floriformis]
MRCRADLVSLAVVTVLLVAAGVYVSGIPRMQMEQGRWVAHTHEVLHQLEILSSQLAQARVHQNAQLPPNPGTVQEEQARIAQELRQTIAELADLTADNSAQQERIKPLWQAISTRLVSAETDSAANYLEIADRISEMSSEEEQLLKAREVKWQQAVRAAQYQFLVTIGVVYLLALYAFRLSRSEANVREQLLTFEREKAQTQRNLAERMAKIAQVQQDIIYERLNYQGAMEVITRRAQDITQADGVVVEMQEGKELVYQAASGTMEPFIGFRMQTEGSLAGLCIASRHMIRCDDTEADARVDKHACRKVGVRSMIVVPLQHLGEIVGVLKVASSRVNAFTADDEHTLQFMAGVLSATLRDATLSEELKTRASTDAMTGLNNHRHFQEFLAKEFGRAHRYDNQLSLILGDVDHFKKYNDTFGHQAGDEVLAQVGAILKKHGRASDCVARYGGEEFALILTQTSLAGAEVVANRICEAMRAAEWPHGAVTMSLGVSCLENGYAAPPELIAQADKALYQSKAAGRDRVTIVTADLSAGYLAQSR